MGLFQSLTGASVRDCIMRDDSILFVVDAGSAGRAIGKRGANVDKASKLLQRKVEVVEYADSLESFVRCIFTPARIESINVTSDPEGHVKVQVHPHKDDQGLAIGKNGRNIEKARILLRRYHDVSTVEVR